MGIEMTGLDDFRGAFQRLRDRGQETSLDGVREYMTDVLKVQSDELVPKLTGALKETARVLDANRPNAVELKYGNSPTQNRAMVDYAAAVHEREDVKHAAPTTNKFLSKPLEDTKEQIAPIVGKKLDELMQEG